MVGIVLSEEQVRAAPPEVRRWLASLMEATLQPGHDFHLDRGGHRYAEDELAVCTPQEVLRLFTMLREDPIAAELFFRLGRDNYERATGRHVTQPVTTAELLQNLLLDPPGFEAALGRIEAALRAIRSDAAARLFRRDQVGHYHLDARTQWNIHQLLVHLLEAQKREAAPALSCALPYRVMPERAA